MWPLFAVRTAWVAVLFAGVGVVFLWFVWRIIRDIVTWFREEFFDEYRELRETSQMARKAKKNDEAKSGRDNP